MMAPIGARGAANGSAQSLPSQPKKQSQWERNVPAATTRPLPLHCSAPKGHIFASEEMLGGTCQCPVPFHDACARSTCRGSVGR
jgi:hypothetical protein